jgi:hypothetical protein
MNSLVLSPREIAVAINGRVAYFERLRIPRDLAIEAVAREHGLDRARVEWLLAQAGQVTRELGEVS